nr:MAG TPA: hypothetical protein [Caudoviricetes sp.]
MVHMGLERKYKCNIIYKLYCTKGVINWQDV